MSIHILLLPQSYSILLTVPQFMEQIAIDKNWKQIDVAITSVCLLFHTHMYERMHTQRHIRTYYSGTIFVA